jgi:hypothetical protein
MYAYEVTVRATIVIESAEDESDAAEQAKFNLDVPDVVDLFVEDIRKIGE